MSDVLNIAGLGVGVVGLAATAASLVYAIKTNLEKKRLERLLRETLVGMVGGIDEIKESSSWADAHFREIREAAAKLRRTSDAEEILRHASDGGRDAWAATRALDMLLGDVVSIQRGLFGRHEIRRPDQLRELVKEVAGETDPADA